MTANEYFDKYYYLVNTIAAAYELDEDQSQELSMRFWELCLSTLPIQEVPPRYFRVRLCTMAKALHNNARYCYKHFYAFNQDVPVWAMPVASAYPAGFGSRI